MFKKLFQKVRSIYHRVRTCPDCKGTGYDFGDGGQCERCGGTGEINEQEEIKSSTRSLG